MAGENRTWGEERIANELKLKLGIRVSPRTLGKYLKERVPQREPDPQQPWRTFVHNHAQAIVACDFFEVVTATFRTLYVFVILELGSRRILHHNVTDHPSSEWTLQQFREALPGDHPYRFVIHDRDRIFSQELDKQVARMGVRILRTPVRAPKANSVCERSGGSLRRECLDFLIPLHERHLKLVLRQFAVSLGYELDRRESWRGSTVLRSGGDKIVVKRNGNGHYVFFSVRDDRNHGTVIDFLQWREDLSLGAVRQILRPWIGRPAIAPQFPKLEPTGPDRMRVESEYRRMANGLRHPYLEHERCLPASLFASPRFAGRVRTD